MHLIKNLRNLQFRTRGQFVIKIKKLNTNLKNFNFYLEIEFKNSTKDECRDDDPNLIKRENNRSNSKFRQTLT